VADYATPDGVRRQATQWSEEIVDCRAFGHEWGPYTAEWEVPQIHVALVCQRCNAQKRFTIDSRNGLYVHRPYIAYPDGYLVKGLGRILGDVKGELRLAAVARYAPRQTPRKRS
jgi:hypothetical protein